MREKQSWRWKLMIRRAPGDPEHPISCKPFTFQHIPALRQFRKNCLLCR